MSALDTHVYREAGSRHRQGDRAPAGNRQAPVGQPAEPGLGGDRPARDGPTARRGAWSHNPSCPVRQRPPAAPGLGGQGHPAAPQATASREEPGRPGAGRVQAKSNPTPTPPPARPPEVPVSQGFPRHQRRTPRPPPRLPRQWPPHQETRALPRLACGPPPEPLSPQSHRERYRQLTGEALDVCPNCGGQMQERGPLPCRPRLRAPFRCDSS